MIMSNAWADARAAINGIMTTLDAVENSSPAADVCAIATQEIGKLDALLYTIGRVESVPAIRGRAAHDILQRWTGGDRVPPEQMAALAAYLRRERRVYQAVIEMVS